MVSNLRQKSNFLYYYAQLCLQHNIMFATHFFCNKNFFLQHNILFATHFFCNTTFFLQHIFFDRKLNRNWLILWKFSWWNCNIETFCGNITYNIYLRLSLWYMYMACDLISFLFDGLSRSELLACFEISYAAGKYLVVKYAHNAYKYIRRSQ